MVDLFAEGEFVIDVDQQKVWNTLENFEGTLQRIIYFLPSRSPKSGFYFTG